MESESQWKEVQRRQAEGSTGIQQATVINSKESQPRPRSGYMNSGMETESEHSYHQRRKHRKHRYCPLSTCLLLMLQYARIRLTYKRETFTVAFVIFVICRKTKMHSCSQCEFCFTYFLGPDSKMFIRFELNLRFLRYTSVLEVQGLIPRDLTFLKSPKHVFLVYNPFNKENKIWRFRTKHSKITQKK